MSTEEFDQHAFAAGDKALYKDGKIYPIATVDFDEKLIGLLMNIPGADEDEVSWVRCENCEFVASKTLSRTRILGKPMNIGELKELIKNYPDQTSFGFRQQPLQQLQEVKFGDDVYVVFQK